MNDSFYRSLLDNLMDGVYFVDPDRTITYWNKGAERISGYSKDEVMGKHCHDNILNHVDHKGQCLCKGECPLAQTLKDGKDRKTDLFLQNRNGERVPVSIRISPIREGGKIVGAVESFSDNSAKVAALQRVERLMEENLTDPLTQVGNRRYAEITLQNRFDEIERYNWKFGLLFIDVDHFKRVNDTYGHSVGDMVLKSLADNLSKNLRSFDFIGRWGGEEFIILLVNMHHENQIMEAAERFRMLIANSTIHHQEELIRITVSIGATISCKEDTIDSILQRADQLMYGAKKAGRNRVLFKEAEVAYDAEE